MSSFAGAAAADTTGVRPLMLIDTHAHVHFKAYADDMDEVIKRSLAQGIQMITVGTQKDTSRTAIETAEKYDGVWAAIGLHPNHLHEQSIVEELETIRTRKERFADAEYLIMSKHPKVVAIGECGFDFYRLPEGVSIEEAREVQEKAVRSQLDLASVADKPIIVHCRDGHADQLRVLTEYVERNLIERRGVIHCFTGTLEEAKAYHALGFLTSFTGIITFPPRKGEGEISPLQQVVKDIPLEMMMIETDSPYLTPIPHRSERNEPAHVHFVAEKIAELKGITFKEVAESTTQTAKRLFRLE